MGVSLRAGLRHACVCWFGIAAAVSIHASVPSKPAHTQTLTIASSRTCNASVLAESEVQPRTFDRVLPTSEFTTASSTVTKRLAGRVFVEDTFPPSSDALQAKRLPLATRSYPALRPPAPMLHSGSASVSNRQRAP
jgi:hypothetical protein